MNFEKKKEVAKVLNRSIMNTMMEQNVPLEECIEIIGITVAAICGAAPTPLEPREQIASFLASFSATLSAGVETKEN
jgi:hypothetical protein